MKASTESGAPIGSAFSASGIIAGFLAAQPFAFAVLVYGIAVGVSAAQAGLSLVDATLMSALVHSGTAQLAVMQTLAAGPDLLLLAGLILISNARYLLYGAALHPWLSRAPRACTLLSLFMLGDTNWTLSMDRHARGERDTGFIMGSGLAMYVAWVVGTAAGAAFVPDTDLSRTVALDFAIVALCAALAAGAWRPRMGPSVGAAGAGAVLCLVCGLLALAPLVCGLAGAAAAMISSPRRQA